MSLANCCRCRLCALAALTQWHSSLNSKSSKHLLRMTLFREISFARARVAEAIGSVTFGNRTSMYTQHVQANWFFSIFQLENWNISGRSWNEAIKMHYNWDAFIWTHILLLKFVARFFAVFDTNRAKSAAIRHRPVHWPVNNVWRKI